MGAMLCCMGCHDREVKPKHAGLLKERGCTDVICCILYFTATVGFFIIALLAFLNGELGGPIRDSSGNACNSTVNDGKPYLYVQNPDGIFTQLFFAERATSRKSICVADCPDFHYSPLENEELTDDNLRKYKKLCKHPEKFHQTDPNSYAEAECMPYAEPTKPALNGLCVPDVTWIIDNSEEAKVATVFVDESISDLELTWQYLVGIIFGSAVLSLVITLCMRWLAGISVWFCIMLFLGGTAGVLGFSCWKYSELKKIKGSDSPLSQVPFAYWSTNTHFWLYLAIGSGIFFFIFLLITIGLRKRIRKAIQVMKIASKALSSSPLTAVFPIFPFAFSCLVLGVFLVAFLSLHTMPLTLEVQSFQWLSDNVILFKLLMLFVCVWQICFLSGFQKVTLAGTYSEYYWNGSSSLMSGIGRAIRYHLGTIGFGSFIIASLRFMLILLALLIKSKRLTSKMKKAAKCLACCISCIERIMNYITDRAYIMVAVKGKNYIKSSQMAMGLIIRNPLHATVLDGSASFVIFIARMLVVGSSIGVAYGFFYVWDEDLTNQLNYPWVPIVVVAIGTYIVSYPFFLVHSVAITTIFLSFIEDCEVNDGTPEKPYANRATQKYFGKRVQKMKNKQKGVYSSTTELNEMS